MPLQEFRFDIVEQLLVSGYELLLYDVLLVFLVPGVLAGSIEGSREIHFVGNFQFAARPDVESQTGISLAAAGQDEHHRPIGPSEAAGERLFIDAARICTVAGVRMHPNAGKLSWMAALVHLEIEEIGDGFILESHTDLRALLLHQENIFDQQQIIGLRDSETADLRVARIAQKQQLGPGKRIKS